MTVHWTRRQLLRLAGTATLTGALTGALKAEGIEIETGLTAGQTPLPFGLTRPVHVGEVCLRAKDVTRLKAYYTSMLGLDVLTDAPDAVTLGAGGTPLLHILALVVAADAARDGARHHRRFAAGRDRRGGRAHGTGQRHTPTQSAFAGRVERGRHPRRDC